MLRTKSIYEPKETHDGTRILVTRYHPRGIKREHYDHWMRELAPSPKLLRGYKQGHMTLAAYAHEYQIEIHNDDAADRALKKLEHEMSVGNITLLCYEREGKFCHRCILKKLLLTGLFFTAKDANNYE